MRILYVFPHPDDESFGPGPAMYAQHRSGHDVFLLTLTRGEATRQRHRFGYSRAEMAEIRAEELREAAAALEVSDLRILDLPDDGLVELDPRRIERAVAEEVRGRRPHVVVTYPVHGISGFPDHLVTHAVVKRVFCALREEVQSLERLAFFTVSQDYVDRQGGERIPLTASSREEIDCVVEVDEEAVRRGDRALDRYETYQEVIEETGVREGLSEPACFEIFQERRDPPLSALTEGITVPSEA